MHYDEAFAQQAQYLPDLTEVFQPNLPVLKRRRYLDALRQSAESAGQNSSIQSMQGQAGFNPAQSYQQLGQMAGRGIRALFMADGGRVNRPTLGLVGEAGPEMRVPLNGGQPQLITEPELQALGLEGPEAVVPLSPPPRFMTPAGKQFVEQNKVSPEVKRFANGGVIIPGRGIPELGITPPFTGQPITLPGPPPMAPSAMERLAQMRSPVPPAPKLWQKIAAGAMGAAAGWHNANPHLRPVDASSAQQNILFPGAGRKQAQFEAEREQLAQQAALERQNALDESRINAEAQRAEMYRSRASQKPGAQAIGQFGWYDREGTWNPAPSKPPAFTRPLVVPPGAKVVHPETGELVAEGSQKPTAPTLETQIAEREKAADRLGLKGRDRQVYVATGRMERPPSTSMANARQSGSADYKNTMSMGRDFRMEQNVKNFNDVRDAFSTIQEAAVRGDGVGDLTLLRVFAKITDPTTGVREEEYRTMQGAMGDLKRLGVRVSQGMWNGQQLTPEGRKQFLDMARSKYLQHKQAYDKTVDLYKRRAKTFGVDPDLVLSEIVADEPKPTAATPQVPQVGGTFQGSKVLKVEKVK